METMTYQTPKAFNFSKFDIYFKEVFPGKPLPSESFLQWLLGYTEGYHTFTSRDLNVVYQIDRPTKEVQILHYICENLGFGAVRKLNATWSRFEVTDRPGVELLVLMYVDKTIMGHKWKDIDIAIPNYQVFIDDGTSLENEDELIFDNSWDATLENEWLAGFIDALGGFKCAIYESNDGTHLQFSLMAYDIWGGAKMNTVIRLVDSIAEMLVPQDSNKDIRYEYDRCELRIVGVENTETLVRYLDNHPLHSNKAKAYDTWKSLRASIKNGEHLNPLLRPGLKALAKPLK